MTVLNMNNHEVLKHDALDIMAYLEKNAYGEKAIALRQSMRNICQHLAGPIHKPVKYYVYLNGRMLQCYALESDAKKYAEFCGGEVRAV